MRVEELKKRLVSEGFNSFVYSFVEKIGTYCLIKENNKWIAFYLEINGEKIGKKEFNTEEEACAHFYSRLEKDLTTRLTALENNKNAP